MMTTHLQKENEMRKIALIVLLVCAMVGWQASGSEAYLKGDVDGDNRITLTKPCIPCKL
jgi:hypothetical protein